MLMQMRCGKSKVLLDDWGEMVEAREVEDLLIIAPAGSYRNWTIDRPGGRESELRRQFDPALMERAAVATWASGSGKSERAVADLLRITGRPRVLNVNVEALSRTKKARLAVMEFLTRRKAVIAVDESTTIRNVGADRTKFIHDLRKMAPYRRIMTGLVAPKSPLDLFGQFYFLDPAILGHWSYYTFRARYAVLRDMPVGEWYTDPRTGGLARRTVKIPVAFKNQDELNGLIAPYSYRKLLADCYDIPETFYVQRDVEITQEQERLLGELRETATAQLAGGTFVSADLQLALALRMHQILSGHVKDEAGDLHMIDNKRVDAVMEVLAEHDGKAIIWSHFVPLLLAIRERIAKDYGPEAVALFYGGNKATRYEDEGRFLGDSNCRFMCATQSAGGRGNTWDNADLAIYASNSFDLEHRDQSEWRTLNVGKRRNVTNVDLVVPGTLDEKVVAALRSKIDVASGIMGDEYRKWLI